MVIMPARYLFNICEGKSDRFAKYTNDQQNQTEGFCFLVNSMIHSVYV
jgi:hypothetical protein